MEIYKMGIDNLISTFDNELPEFEKWDSAHVKICRLVIEENEKIIGWAALTPISAKKAYWGAAELSIYISDGYKSKGVGSMLLNALIEESEKNGFWSLQSIIFEENVPSIKLHEKFNFRKIGYREKIARDRFGNWHNVILMERRNNF